MSNSFFTELKRRNVFRVITAYVVISWLLLQIGDTLFNALRLDDSANSILLAILALAFIPVAIFSWAYELTPEGIKKESDIENDPSITSHTAKKLDYITIAAVVFPTASSLSVLARISRPSLDISATPPALSAMGP